MNENISYAGFWKRFLAFILDKLILMFATSILFVPIWILGFVGIIMNSEDGNYERFTSVSFQHNWDNEFSVAMFSAAIVVIIVVAVLNIVIEWLYFAFMESSSKQATFGKIIVGIIVTDTEGNKISFAKATGRYFGKFISGFILGIGYLLAAFTEKKQTLHDIFSSCLVVDKFNFRNETYKY
jgi:uncharacterized RDD family membrane protein YckC